MHIKAKRKNIKKTIGTQLNFVLEIKLRRYTCLANYDCFFGGLCVHFELLLGWECAYVWHNIRTEKESIYGKYSEYKTSNWHTSDLHHGKNLQREHFLAKEHSRFEDLYIHFEPLLG